MATNPYVNKIIVNNSTRIDLTADTVVPSVLISGYSAHNAAGATITGNLVVQNYYDGTTEPSSGLGNNGDLYLKHQ